MQKKTRLVHRVISLPIVSTATQRVVCARNSQMAFILSQIRVRLMQCNCNLKLSTRYREKPWKSLGFYSSGEPEIEEILDGSPAFSFAQISPLLWSFSRFWSSFIGIEVLNEQEYSILRILYCYSLQQHIFLAFCNDFDTHYRMFAHTLLRNNALLFPKWRQKATRPILRYSSVVNMEMGKITNFENS